jgi:DNA gyrase/topoisomerase IV subunit B
VNSICTVKGGTHVDAVATQLVNHLIEAVKKKDKKSVQLKPFQAKSHLWVFVNSRIVNPTFDRFLYFYILVKLKKRLLYELLNSDQSVQ